MLKGNVCREPELYVISQEIVGQGRKQQTLATWHRDCLAQAENLRNLAAMLEIGSFAQHGAAGVYYEFDNHHPVYLPCPRLP